MRDIMVARHRIRSALRVALLANMDGGAIRESLPRKTAEIADQ
jgi:hypothetical protein